MISYPNCEGLGEWEPAAMIFRDHYEWENVSTAQMDVYLDLLSILTPKKAPYGGQARNYSDKNL